jgi:hypothetical protein
MKIFENLEIRIIAYRINKRINVISACSCEVIRLLGRRKSIRRKGVLSIILR